MFFCNINFNLLHKDDLFVLPNNREGLPKFIVTVNAEFIWFANTNKRFMEIINSNYVTFDGMTSYRKAKKKLKRNDFDKLSGSDIIYDFCQYSKEHNLKLFLLGGNEDSNNIAVKRIKEQYSIKVNGFSPPYESYPFSEKFNRDSIEKLSYFRPDVLFVGFGMPKQEYWVEDNKQQLRDIGIKYIVGCGGTIDFVAGKIKRAPRFIQKVGLETLYRIIKEFPDLTRIKRTINACRYFKYINNKPDF